MTGPEAEWLPAMFDRRGSYGNDRNLCILASYDLRIYL